MSERFDELDVFILGNPQGNYPDIFVEHALRPKNAGSMEGANGFGSVSGHDGNVMEIWLRVEDDVIAAATFWTDGCGTTIACGSMVTETVKGKQIIEALNLTTYEIEEALGGLPGNNCTCAKLAVDTFKKAASDYLAFKQEPWRRKYAK
jgi:nitrogen fixation NifU-like protein